MTLRFAQCRQAALVIAPGGIVASGAAASEDSRTATGDTVEAPAGLLIPQMSAKRGRKLFAEKGCIVCHSVNDVGGHHTPFDAGTMDMPMNAFEFAARMSRGAEAMTMRMRQDLGYVMDLKGQELADIIAFVHDKEEQRKFSWDDVPEEYRDLVERDHDHSHDDNDEPHGH